MTGLTLFRIGSVEVRFCDGWSEITIPTLPMLSIPWTEKPEDRALAERLGYDDPVLMNRDHDVVHLLIAHWLGRGVAPALSYAAGLRPAHPGWRLEEDAVLSMQAWMQASSTSLEEMLRPYRVAEPAAPIGVGGAAPRAPADAGQRSDERRIALIHRGADQETRRLACALAKRLSLPQDNAKVLFVIQDAILDGMTWVEFSAPGHTDLMLAPEMIDDELSKLTDLDRAVIAGEAEIGTTPLVVRPLSATKGADWALCLDVPGEMVVAVSPGVAGFTRYVERDRRNLEALARGVQDAGAWERQCKRAWDALSDRDATIANLEAQVDLSLYGVYYADFAAVGIRHPNDGIRTCTGLNLEALAAAKRLRARGLVTVEDSPAGPMVAWVEGRGRAVKPTVEAEGLSHG